MQQFSVGIIGAGLAGSEAALVLSRRNIAVTLYEMRPRKSTPAHKTDLPAELVCSNSLKAYGTVTAPGLLKKELEDLHSPLIHLALQNRVPAGSALAVDRLLFSESVLKALSAQPHITVEHTECDHPPENHDAVIIATGPLTSSALVQWLKDEITGEFLHFYDAIAPVVDRDSVDTNKCFYSNRHEAEATDYLNCPFTKEEYTEFYAALIEADQTVARDFEKAEFFEACLPVEVLASRGFQTLAFGPLKPIGLIDPRTGKRPYAVCQLRRENTAGESFSLVGFQTRLKQGEQRRVFRKIPGLENAEFLKYGSIHRNTYINAPSFVSDELSFIKKPSLFIAGQLSGNEGYTESIATGHAAALFCYARLNGSPIPPLPPETALGALVRHITRSDPKQYCPSNINYGLFPPVPIPPGKKKVPKKEKKQLLFARAQDRLHQWILSIKDKGLLVDS